jgi:hypothetical protein
VEAAAITVPDHCWDDQGQQSRANQRGERPGTGTTKSDNAQTEQTMPEGGSQRSNQQQVHRHENSKRLEGARSPDTKSVAQEPDGDDVADSPVHEDGNYPPPESCNRARAAIRHTKSASRVFVGIRARGARALEPGGNILAIHHETQATALRAPA